MIKYVRPSRWARYDPLKMLPVLADAKAAVMSLKAMPYQRAWVEALQQIQLRREVAGTSKIEGADFTENELDAAMKETPEQLATRSQRQARAAAATYRWLRSVPDDRPIDVGLICEVHRRIVTGADDDHVPPGYIRQRDQNVTFGVPRHRGVEGGDECAEAFASLCTAIQRELKDHDELIQGLVLHYHFVAMHPFLDGNGRTGRAMEALMLQRAGLRDGLFVPLSNYYYDEKHNYMQALADSHENDHDLTPFLIFGLRGIELQCKRLLSEIKVQVEKAIYRNLMFDLFGRLKSPKKRVIVGRQIEILKLLLRDDEIQFDKLIDATATSYGSLSNPEKALVRDLSYLRELGALAWRREGETGPFFIFIRLQWPSVITETDFFRIVRSFPKAKTHAFLQ